MKKKTLILLLISLLIVLLLGLMLFLFYKKDQKISFHAKVYEAYSSYALVKPLNSSLNYDVVDVPIKNLKVGDIIKVTCIDKFKETYPPEASITSYEVISSEETPLTTHVETTMATNKITTITPNNPNNYANKETTTSTTTTAVIISQDDSVLNSINDDITYASSSNGVLSFKDKCKESFIKVIDFIFYNGEINGYHFKDLTNKAKLKVITLALKLDDIINKYYPNYKMELSSSYQNAKSKLIELYLNKTTEYCNNHDDICAEAKEDFQMLKTSLNITWDIIKNLSNAGVTKLKEWYMIYSGK